MLHNLACRFYRPVHHGCRGLDAQLVCLTVHLQPGIFVQLLGCDDVTHTVTEYLSTRTGDRAEPLGLEPCQYFRDGEVGAACDIVYLNRGEAVNGHLRVLLMDMFDKIFIPLYLQLGMHPTLKEDLRTADGEQLFDLLINLIK